MASDKRSRMLARQELNNNQCLLLALLCSVVACTASLASSSSSRGSFGIIHQRHHHNLKLNQNNEQLFRLLRGGSTAQAAIEEETKEEEGNEGNDEEDDEDPFVSVMSAQPVRLLIQTNWGNQVLDQRVELMAARTRNVASLKKSLSRQLPGRPPILGLEIVYEGRVLEDEMLVDELFDDDDEDDDDDEEDSDEPSKTLILNAVPPVDPKFATELGPKLQAHVEDDDETLSTEELVEAFFLNQAAMSRNAQLLANPSIPPTPLLRLEVQEQAKQLREHFKSQIPEEVWQSSLEPVRKSHHTEERRGQRYRSGKGGARTNLKKSIQHNMNIHWGETIRNCLLFLFFGYFGGRNSISRYLMLWGAPLCFILQARPVKMWSKILFYMISNPPGIISSLLAAPQQAILNFDMEKSYAVLYSTEEEEKAAEEAALKSKVEEDDDDDEDELDEDEESEAESDVDESEDEDDEDDQDESEEEDEDDED